MKSYEEFNYENYEVSDLQEVSVRLHQYLEEHLPDYLREALWFDEYPRDYGYEVWMELHWMVKSSTTSTSSLRQVEGSTSEATTSATTLSTRSTSESIARVTKSASYEKGESPIPTEMESTIPTRKASTMQTKTASTRQTPRTSTTSLSCVGATSSTTRSMSTTSSEASTSRSRLTRRRGTKSTR